MCNKKKHFLILLKKLIICIKNIERIKFCVITRSINRFPHKWNVKDSKLFIQKTAVPMLSSTSWFAEIVEFSSNKFSRHRTLSVWSISPVRFDQVPILPLTPISIIHPLLPLVGARQGFHYSPRSYAIPILQRGIGMCVHDACNRLVWIVVESHERGSPFQPLIDRYCWLDRLRRFLLIYRAPLLFQ